MNVEKEVAAMKQMTVGELREKYAEVFRETTTGRNKDWLIKRIAWRMQANAEGGLSERARMRALEIANDADLRLTAPKPPKTIPMVQKKVAVASPANKLLPPPGTTITREYKGRTLEVRVLPDGFEFEGERFASLSAVAKAITGSHCSGNLFFRLAGRGGKA